MTPPASMVTPPLGGARGEIGHKGEGGTKRRTFLSYNFDDWPLIPHVFFFRNEDRVGTGSVNKILFFV